MLSEEMINRLESKAKSLLRWGLFVFTLSTSLIVFLPLIVTKCTIIPLDVGKPNEIGDTIGGIMGPIVALVGVLLTFLAFWAQYVANEQQKMHFAASMRKNETENKEKQFESHFFEMLKLHKENVNELCISDFLDKDDKSEKKGRQVFYVMSKIFDKILGYSVSELTFQLTPKNFNQSYQFFFWGTEYIDKLDSQLAKKLTGTGLSTDFYPGDFKNYQGVSYSLGHYFRHLFLTMKFVVASSAIDNKEKMKYLKILRAQLSNHEQIMLFYNWLSGYGEAWEDDKNSFFIDYKMIHNLWSEQLFKDQYIVDKVNNLIDNYNAKYHGKEGHKPLFEFQGDDFCKKMPDISFNPSNN
jgi:hypothetical protein